MKKIIVIFIVFLASLILIVSFLENNYVVPILMYHSIDSDGVEYSNLAISEDLFEKQMAYLADNNYNCLPLKELAYLVENKKSIPRKTIAITFDDGYENNFTIAYPILKRYNLNATIFVVVKNIGKVVDDKYFKNAKFMSVQQLRRLNLDKLIEIGSHTLNHYYLPEIDRAKLKDQIFKSKQILESRLQGKIDFFSYPIGGFNRHIQQMVKDAGYLTFIHLLACVSPLSAYHRREKPLRTKSTSILFIQI